MSSAQTPRTILHLYKKTVGTLQYLTKLYTILQKRNAMIKKKIESSRISFGRNFK